MKQFKTKYITIYECSWTYGGAEEGGWWDWLRNPTIIIPYRNGKQLKKAMNKAETECKEFNSYTEGTDKYGLEDHLEYYFESKKSLRSKSGIRIWE